MSEELSESQASKSLFLLDGSALAYRAHYAMVNAGLSSPAGVPTGATYGFAMDLKRLMEKTKPFAVAAVFDTPKPTFRHKLFTNYKATRQKMPEELLEQLPYIKRVAGVLGFPVLEVEGFEADDVIGTLALRAAAGGLDVFIVTGDKDFMQIVGPRIRLYNVMKRDSDVEVIGKDEVVAKFGVPPDRVVDVLALMGDASDNVPGIPSVGQKTAVKLVQRYGSIEEILENAGQDVSPRVKKNLHEYREQGLLSKRLVTIDTDVPLDVEIGDLTYRGARREEASTLFRELGFKALAEEMSEPEVGFVAAGDYKTLQTAEQLRELRLRLEDAQLYAVDTETTDLVATRAIVVGLSFALADGEAFYVPLNARPPIIEDSPNARRGDAVLAELRSLLENPERRKCLQNAKYDLLVLRNHGVELRGIRTDTMLASYLLEPQERERGLDALTLRHFGHVKIKTEELIGRGKDQVTMDLLPVEDVGLYACEDADFTFRLADRFVRRIDEAELTHLHDEVELPLIDVLADMESAGVRVDRDHLKKMSKDLEDQSLALEEKIQQLAGHSFNVNSPRQIGEVLFETLRIQDSCGYRPKKTQTGWSTGHSVLEDLALHHPLPALVLEHRTLTKLLTTYIRTLPQLVDEVTGRIHTSFNQTVAATGRLSSSDPNLQNIPIRTETGRRIREAFLPATSDHRILSADYSQVELRILAHLSQDEALIQAFQEGADIHRDTAARVFNIARDQVDATLRSRAKAVNFGVLYGMGPQRLSRETDLTLEEAKTFIARYFAAFPAVRDFLEGLKDEARHLGYARTLMGRRRPLPDIRSSNRGIRAAAENMAVNTPIQGSAADILKVAMVRIHRRLRAEGLSSRMILTVHDELVFDVPVAEVATVSSLVRQEMQGAASLSVPLQVELGVGRNWLEAH